MQMLCTPKADVYGLGIVMWEIATQVLCPHRQARSKAACMRGIALLLGY